MFIFHLTIIIVVAKLAGALSVKLGQPSVLGEIIAGILLGPSVFGLIEASNTLETFSTIGVILLMFLAGLETDVDEFKRAGKSSTLVGFGGIIAPLFLGYAVGLLMDLTHLQSWFLGAMLSATSVSISVQALKEMNQLKTREGSTILGAAVIDDIVVMIILAFLMGFAGGGDISFTALVMKKVAFFFVAILVAWKVVPWVMRQFTKLPVSEVVISIALIICFAYAYTAELTGVANIIGAYIAGIAVGLTNFKQEVTIKLETISYSLFVPVFFAYIGISAEFTGIIGNIGLIIGLSIFAILTKLIGAGFGAKLSGFNWRSSAAIGSAMISRGEVALIVASMGLASGLVTQDLYATMIVVIIVTTIVTPPMMKWTFTTDTKEKLKKE